MKIKLDYRLLQSIESLFNAIVDKVASSVYTIPIFICVPQIIFLIFFPILFHFLLYPLKKTKTNLNSNINTFDMC